MASKVLAISKLMVPGGKISFEATAQEHRLLKVILMKYNPRGVHTAWEEGEPQKGGPGRVSRVNIIQIQEWNTMKSLMHNI